MISAKLFYQDLVSAEFVVILFFINHQMNKFLFENLPLLTDLSLTCMDILCVSTL